MIVYLNIPFEDLSVAKQHGVKWDLDKRMWFIKDHPLMLEKCVEPELHPFVQLFGKWFATKMTKIKYPRIKRRTQIGRAHV